ncbi:FkbM family methyltransferase [bacterium]|nr:FkbM family methyltransferase [bacterium]
MFEARARVRGFLHDRLPGLYKRRIRAAALSGNDPRFEPEIRIVRRLVQRGSSFLDVGANTGIYSIVVEDLLGARNVYSIEPGESAFKELARLRTPARAYQLAISDKEGTARLHIPRINGELVGTRASLSADSGETQIVQLMTIDRFVEREVKAAVGFIKIDVEGHEDQVLAGAAETLARCRPALLVEIEQRHHEEPLADCFARLAEDGYRAHYFEPDDRRIHPVSEFDLERDQASEDGGRWINDFFLLPEEREEEFLRRAQS